MACSEIRKLKKEMKRLHKKLQTFSPEQIDKGIEGLLKIEDAEKRKKAIDDLLKRSSPIQALQFKVEMLARYLEIDIRGKKAKGEVMLPLISWN